MSVAPNGRDAVLAGRKGLFVIDLDDPFAAPRWLHHETSWEVADVQWSPHKSKPSWIVSTSNQKAMVWNIARPSHDAIEHVLHSHTRAITDINFHPNHPELLATCSVDSFVLSWDLRCPQSPIHQWADWRAGSSQVKWNYIDPNILASAHDSHILIWDARKGALPLHRINAHEARINGIDWSRENKHRLISCSNDMSVKFWSYNVSCDTPTYTIHTDFPVARARHVPFGDHICGIMPSRGGNNSVYIVKYGDKEQESNLRPSYIFKGHTEPVKDFVWRTRHHENSSVDDREFQLVTWSADCDLRLWPINQDIYDNFNYVKNKPLPQGIHLQDFDYRSYRPEPPTSSENSVIIRHHRGHRDAYSSPGGGRGSFTLYNDQFNHLNWISGIKVGQSAFQNVDNDFNRGFNDDTQPLNLGEEVSNVGHKFPRLRFEKISVSTGNLVISLNGPWSSDNKDGLIFIRVEIDFPENYPSKNGCPKFSLEQTHELSETKRQELLKNSREIAEKYCEARKFCLEPCMRFLLGERVSLDFTDSDEELPLDPYVIPYEGETAKNDEFSEVSGLESASISTASENVDSDEGLVPGDLKKPSFDSTPVPKGCGAIWTPSGHLVCFFNPKEAKKEQTIKFGQQGFSLMNPLRMGIPDNDRLELELTSSASSTSSLANDLDILQYDRLYRTNIPEVLRGSAVAGTLANHNYSLSTDRSQGTSNSRSKHNRNIVKIYDFTRLIPAKMELAYGYRVLGDTPENLAQHNALVAEKYGYKDIANCWKLLSILLVKDVEVDTSANGISANPQNELIDKFTRSIDRDDVALNYRFYWGSHPFGGQWLTHELMKYYEAKEDIQMLAMMSCILYEHNTNDKRSPEIPINTSYFVPVVSRTSSTEGSTSFHGIPQRPHMQSAVSFNARTLPGNATNMNRSMSTLSSISADSSLKNSESHRRRGIKQSNTTTNDNQIPHIPSIVTIEGSLPQYSPSSVASSAASNVFSHSFDKFMMNNGNANVSGSQQQRQQLKVSTDFSLPQVKLQILNKESLDLYDNVHSMDMEGMMDKEKLKLYRIEYASLLFFWGLPVSRAKILQFNYTDESETSDEYIEHRGEIGWIKQSQDSYNYRDRLREMKKCHYCLLQVKKRVTVCTHCHHIMHAECAMKWWEREKMMECASGCGCHCLEYKIVDM
ncbi:hypothetical protein FOA43_001766 [Brettanomyces nanus]|uniref:RWD domain-containing protein n=1 Tax=Eeniella nana TaxID=13502 RepID=A0A875RUC9_EENNA|nr:uncharacterized protein FOA43_001766 [Brettanomyces nanus]QPG74437.1 hypothetical protein FOA43_001766 [Brettanomyces nanus]